MRMEEKDVQQKRRHRNTKVGVVVSDKMDKTVVIKVERKIFHPRYRKVINRTNRFMAHDETNLCTIGDRIEIVETRPLSRRKRWAVKQILEKAR